MEKTLPILEPQQWWNGALGILNNKSAINFGKIIEVVLAGMIFFYFIFSLMIVRQVSLMTRFLATSMAPWLKVVAWIYVLCTALVLLLVLGIF